MDFSPQQDGALVTSSTWMKDPSAKQVFYMAGFAGTGKTTIAKHLVSGETRRWLFASLTGRATHVMRQKGCHGAQTIHSLIYRPNGESKSSEISQLEIKIYDLREKLLEEEQMGRTTAGDDIRSKVSRLEEQLKKLHLERAPQFALWANSPLADPDVAGVIVDECSMVDDRLGEDLESFGKKILAQGDPAQLPPVGAAGRYSKRQPDVMLTEVHRQARESGILRLATAVRNGTSVYDTRAMAGYSGDVEIVNRASIPRERLAQIMLDADQVLVGRNATRRSFNVRLRELLGHKSPGPEAGDRLVCLRNNRQLGLYNGSQWRVDSASVEFNARTCQLELRSEDDGRDASVSAWLHPMIGEEDELKSMGWNRRDLEEFDYAYAMTVHKAQGGQWDDVTLYDESRSFGSETGSRWLYTGVTRAAKKLTVII